MRARGEPVLASRKGSTREGRGNEPRRARGGRGGMLARVAGERRNPGQPISLPGVHAGRRAAPPRCPCCCAPGGPTSGRVLPLRAPGAQGGQANWRGTVRLPGLDPCARVGVGPAGLLRSCGLAVWEFDHLLASQAPFAPYHASLEPSPIMDLSAGYAGYLEERRAKKTSKRSHGR
jgi:hypothetical protein